MDGKTLYDNICRIAWGNGITVNNMCYEANIRPSVLSDLKMERKKSLDDKTLYKLADVLDCDKDDFFRKYTTPMPPKPTRATRLNSEYTQIAEAMNERPDLRRLFRAALKANPKQVRSVAALLETFNDGTH